jgi:hypothetical protein
MRVLLRSLAAIAGGYGAITVLTIHGFRVLEKMSGFRDWYGTPPPVLLAATFVTVIAGLAGGSIAGQVGAFRPIANAALVLLPIIADSTWVFLYYKGSSPKWFEVIGALTLMACTIAGGALNELRSRSRHQQPRTVPSS